MFKNTDIYDVTGIGGALLVSVGSGMIYLPAGLIVLGVLMLAGTVMGLTRGTRPEKRD